MTKEQDIMKATQEVEAAWRSNGLVPACPHCKRGILPEDRLGSEMVGEGYEMAVREREREGA